MEVSSIGYNEGRIGNLKYHYCVLTNLKSDHLDYHTNLKNYHTAKINLIQKWWGKQIKVTKLIRGMEAEKAKPNWFLKLRFI